MTQTDELLVKGKDGILVLDKKEMKFEELNSVAGGNAVGPVKETGPLGTGPIGIRV